MRLGRLRSRFSILFVLLSWIYATPSATCQPSGSAIHDMVFTLNLPHNAPLRFESLILHGQDVPLNKPVHVTQDWLTELKLTITNTAPKTLTYFSGSIDLPQVTLRIAYGKAEFAERQTSDGELGLEVNAGVQSAFLLHRRDGTFATPQATPISIGPGETVTLTVKLPEADTPKQLYGAVPELAEARFMLSILWYADDTCFFNGEYQKVSDFTQRKLTPISAAEFLGR